MYSEKVKMTNFKKTLEYMKKKYDFVYKKIALDKIHNYWPNIDEAVGEKIPKTEYTLDYPKNSIDVGKWGDLMSNCFATRAGDFAKGEKLLMGVKHKKKLLYVFEINMSDNSYGHFTGVGNSTPERGIRQKVKRFLLNKSVI